MQLRGKISHSLLELRHLIYLDLSFNNFGGTQFPIDYKNASLTKLKLFHIGYTNFGGTIAPFLRNLSSLQYLILRESHFYDIGYHNWISTLPSLVWFDLSGIPLLNHYDWFHTISNNLFHLQGFRLDSCFSGNEINTLALPSLNSSSALGYIGVRNNEFVIPSIHPWLSNITQKIIILDLGSNVLKASALADFDKMYSLQLLSLANTTLVGSLPKSFGNMSQLHYLDLSWNKFNVRLVELIQSLSGPTESSLQVLELSNSQIKGSLFDYQVNFSSLFVLYLDNNHLNGVISKSNLINLQILDLSNNFFSYMMANCFENMQNLQILNLGNNNFSGEVPPCILSLSNLEVLNLQNNIFSGELPFCLINFAKLKFIDISHNKLVANISTWIGENQSSLLYINIGSNQFYGAMPLELCHLKDVQVLDFSENNITGVIPYCLNNLKAFSNGNSNATIAHHYTIYVQDPNQPQFGVPFDYIARSIIVWKGLKFECSQNLGRFRIIDFSCNKLVGHIPKEITTLSSLKQLNLSNNRLIGVVPENINGFKQLESLDLSCNHLSGELPSSMSDLNFLSTLNLSHNNFSGKIPSSTQIQSFNASVFSDNPSLCGPPLQKKCPEDNSVENSQPDVEEPENQDDEFVKSLYIGMGIGFVVSFWGVSGILLLKRSYRHDFFKLLDKLEDQVHVRTVLLLLKMKDCCCCCCSCNIDSG